MSDPWSKETGDKVEQRLSVEQVCDKYNALTEAFDLADGLRRSHQAEIVRLNAALADAQTENLNLRRHRNELRKRVVFLECVLIEIRDHPEEDGVADSMEALAREALEAALLKIRDEPGDARDCRYIAGQALAGGAS